MTYRPRRLAPDDALAAIDRHDLVPWTTAADLVGVTPKTMSHWLDRGRVASIVVRRVRHVDMAEVSRVEGETRARGRRT